MTLPSPADRGAIASATSLKGRPLLLCAALWTGASGAAPPDQAAYAVPHERVDIGSGQRLNLYCAGRGTPTVVFDAGSGLAGWDWLLVHPRVAARTRACVYDRAGFGFSDPSVRPGTSEHAVDDLHRLLRAAGIAPPYVLVGHSYGGANVQLFAYAHPADVAGLVLVDAGHENEAADLDRLTHGKYALLVQQQFAQGRACAAEAQAGRLLPGAKAFEECVGAPPPMFGTALAAAYLAQQMSGAYWAASLSEAENESVSDAQLRAARASFGSLPLVYLTHGISPFQVPGQPQSEMNKATERAYVMRHREVAALSSRGRERVVPGAAHSIHVDRPGAVVDAVFEVVAQARAAASPVVR